jgi:hypothetical protein
LALYAQSYWSLLRRRQLLGVEKAIGATKRQLALRLIGSQIPWGLAGGSIGCIGLLSLYLLMPGVFLTWPPLQVLVAALMAPLLALLILAAAVTLPVLTLPAMALLRGRVEGALVRPLLVLVYGGLALALAGGLAASQVHKQVRHETEALDAQFGKVYALQAGDPVIDDRAARAFEAGEFWPVFSAGDAERLDRLPDVEAAVVAQTIPGLAVTHSGTTVSVRAVAGDDRYLNFMGLKLESGGGDGCVLSARIASRLDADIGDVIGLGGLGGPVSCRVSGLLIPPPELWSWLVEDLPELVVPPLNGLGLPLPGYDAIPFRSTRILLRLFESSSEDAIGAWQRERHPEIQAEVVPYTPDVGKLLSSLQLQARLFLLISLLAAGLSSWGIAGGFMALLEAERFRIALDRALGLSLQRITRAWWLQTLGLGLSSTVVGVAVGYFFAQRLYNALALDIPNLPGKEALFLSPEFLLVIILALGALSAGLTSFAAHWIRRQSTMELLKDGT